jgi:hypothetical protein
MKLSSETGNPASSEEPEAETLAEAEEETEEEQLAASEADPTPFSKEEKTDSREAKGVKEGEGGKGEQEDSIW